MAFWSKKEKAGDEGGVVSDGGVGGPAGEPVPIPQSARVPKAVLVPEAVRIAARPASAREPRPMRRSATARVLVLADPEKRCAAASAKLRAAGAHVVECEDVAAAGVALAECGMVVFPAAQDSGGVGGLLERAWDEGCQLVGLSAGGAGTPNWVAEGRFVARVVGFDEEGEIWEHLVDAAATPVRMHAADRGVVDGATPATAAVRGTSAPIRSAVSSFERSVGHSVLGQLGGWVVVMDRVGLILGSSQAFSEAVSKRGRLFGRSYWEALPVRGCGFGMKEHAALVEGWRTGVRDSGFETLEEVFSVGGEEVRVLWSLMPYCPDGETVQGLVRFGVPIKPVLPGGDAEGDGGGLEEDGLEASEPAVDAVFEEFFSATREAMVRLDAKGRVVAVNPALRRLAGWADDRDPTGLEVTAVFAGGYSRIGGWGRFANGLLVGIEEVLLPGDEGAVCRVCEMARHAGAAVSDLRRRLGEDLRLLASLAEISVEAAEGGGAQENLRLASIAYAATGGADFAADQVDVGPLLGRALNLAASGCGVRLKWDRQAGTVDFPAGDFLLLALLVRYLLLALGPVKGERFEVSLRMSGDTPCLRMERVAGVQREPDEGALGIAGLLAEQAGCALDVGGMYEGVMVLLFPC